MVPAGSRRIPRAPRYSGYHYACLGFPYRTFTVSGPSFQKVLVTDSVQQRGPTTPYMRCHIYGLGSFPFARHYLGNHYLFSLPAGTKMFQFPALASHLMRYAMNAWVVPFGNLRIKGHLHLPGAYRSLSRPSSPL